MEGELTTLYEIRAGKYEGRIFYQIYIPITGEIREATEFEPLLRHLASENGFYLRKK